MNTLQKKLYYGFLGITLATFAYVLYQNNQTNALVPDHSYGQEIFQEFKQFKGSVNDFYAERFNIKENELWEALAEKNISKDTCLQKQEAFRNNYKKNLPKDGSRAIPRETLEMIHSVAHDFGFNPNDIVIVEQDMGGCPAASDDFVLYINLHWLGTYSQSIQEFIIAHELCHMINRDPSLQTILEDYIKRDDPFWNVMSRFCEARADITASTCHPKYAQGGIEYAEALYKKYGKQNNTTHPNNIDRKYAHETIHALLQHDKTTPSYA